LKILAKRLALLLGCTASLLLLLECGARVRIHQLNKETLLGAMRDPPDPGQDATLRQIIQLSLDDRIAYEMRPNLRDVSFKGGRLNTNSLGFRSAEVPLEKPHNGVTIVGLGDSIMFGHGVSDGEPYLDQLGDLLNQRRPDIEWRIINTGAPGYNAVMEVTTLETKTLDFEPDLIVLGLCGNDYSPPNYVRIEDDVWDTSRAYLLEFVRERLNRQDAGARYRSEALSYRKRWEKETGALAPPRYAELYGKQAFLGALKRLKQLSEQHGFEVVAFLQVAPASNGAKPLGSTQVFQVGTQMLNACMQLGFHTVSMQAVIEEHIETVSGEPFSWELFMDFLAASADNAHPNAQLHQMSAQRLLAFMQKSGLLYRLAGPKR
jgi:hypothetical protein